MNKTILVVDDSAVLRASVRYILQSAGFEVQEADDGSSGLQALQKMAANGQRPALILTDINMPVMDGITFITEVKKTGARFTPILVLTTESQATKKMQGKQAGASGWLVKPFDAPQLLGVVKRFVR